MQRQRKARDIESLTLDESEIADLVAFMHALTGRNADKTPFGVPSDFAP